MINRHAQPLSEKEIVEIAIGYAFREEGLKQLAGVFGVSATTVKRRLAAFGVCIRNTHQQRHCDRRRGRFSQAEAIHGAWGRGDYDTEAVRTSRKKWYGYERHGERNPFFGKKHSDDTRQRIAEQARMRVISGTGEYGDDWTEELRERIVARDGHRCQVCGADDRMLQVHHVDHDRTNNIQANLLTLCASCHLAYHGRRELVGAMRAAHAVLMERLTQAPGVPPC